MAYTRSLWAGLLLRLLLLLPGGVPCARESCFSFRDGWRWYGLWATIGRVAPASTGIKAHVSYMNRASASQGAPQLRWGPGAGRLCGGHGKDTISKAWEGHILL
jgi:hypothetical protein